MMSVCVCVCVHAISWDSYIVLLNGHALWIMILLAYNFVQFQYAKYCSSSANCVSAYCFSIIL